MTFYFINIRCDAQALEDALLKRVMITPEEVIKKSLDPLNATVSRDGLAKTIYSRLFDWYDYCLKEMAIAATLYLSLNLTLEMLNSSKV